MTEKDALKPLHSLKYLIIFYSVIYDVISHFSYGFQQGKIIPKGEFVNKKWQTYFEQNDKIVSTRTL